jgi:hypothetical protein
MISNRKPQRDPYFHKLNGYDFGTLVVPGGAGVEAQFDVVGMRAFDRGLTM